MSFQLKAPYWAIAAGLLVVAWFVQSSASDQVASSGASSSHPGPQAWGPGRASHDVGTAFPWGSVGDDGSAKEGQTGSSGARQQIAQLLADYSSGVIFPEDKKQIQNKWRSIMSDPVARSQIVQMFLDANNPQQALSVFGLIRDADVKDPALIEELIQRDSDSAVNLSKGLIVDLIADLGTRHDVPYSATVDQYLSQVAQGPDADLRASATAQKIWYQSRYQPDSVDSLAPYLQDTEPRVREEMYGMIESRLANHSLSGQKQLAGAIDAALRDDRLNMSPEERTRAATLLANIQ